MMLPAAIIGLTGLVAATKKEKVIPPHIQAQRQAIFEAMLECHDAALLRRVSQAFLKEGYRPEGHMLELRARLAEAPADVKAQRREWLQAGLSSKRPSGVRNMAAAFDAIGATGCAVRLRQHAKALEEKGITGDEPEFQNAQPETTNGDPHGTTQE